jgi:hypothetical protein
MRLLLAALLASTPAWAQRDNPNGPPSKAAQQQEKQADYARKGHPQSGKPHKQEPAALRTKDSPAKSSRKPRPGEAALRSPK